MNKFPITLSPVKWPVCGRTNQLVNLEQTMTLRINTTTGWNPDSTILGTRNKKLSSKSKKQFKRQDVRKLIQSIQHLILCFGHRVEISSCYTASILTCIWVHPVFQQTLNVKKGVTVKNELHCLPRPVGEFRRLSASGGNFTKERGHE